jgi:hypothetical protein
METFRTALFEGARGIGVHVYWARNGGSDARFVLGVIVQQRPFVQDCYRC